MQPLRGEDQGLLAHSYDGLDSPLLTPPHEDGPAEPLIKTGVEGAPAWQHMSARQRTMVYVTFGLLGLGVLLPFNSLITPAEYFRSTFARTPYANTFSSCITVSYNLISILVGIHATATGGFERSSPRRRITLSATVITASVFLLALSTRIGHNTLRSGHHDDGPALTPSNSYFYFTLLVGGLLSSACAYLQNSVVSLSTAFGAGGTFMGSMLAGQGIAGFGISIFGFASAWSQQVGPASGVPPAVAEAAPETARGIARAATLFFGMNTMLMMTVLGAFLWLANTPLYSQVMAKQVIVIDKIQDERDGPSGLQDDDVEDRAEHHMTQSWHSIRSVSHPSYSSWLKKVPGFYSLSPTTRESLLRISLVQSKVKWDCAAVAFVFVITLSLFPALTSSVQSVYTGSSTSGSSSIDLTSPQLFVPFHFFLFNFSDLIGRMLPSLVPAALIRKARALFTLSLLRSLFVPLFMACNVVSTSQRTGPIDRIIPATSDGWLASLLHASDAPFFILMLLLGLSNGLVSTCIMISGPSRTKLVNSKGATEGPLAATLLSFWLCVGLAIGSGLSFLTVKS
ncbi:related to Inhibitor-sensitive equilibrative nucleoside transporter 1 [Melanopsichium pennsylvanicum]|uniref:Related to Inhibitor-sensitive equilibrative nucleoside transporter 1 n=2 Tax=Melanopsichium pennsylvanicum TaxID=63383 RepID=A0AAJ4XGX6_9BASI|nr:related to Inhibitor-sensitive equilibrative nucleoside transporter 1 [Melanopsichium pennsylvanicum 4]SNX81846.1 related to Inhibitor-sensitive equilibrative nucleoside transporter 1 [Melanopsichium pennsylvanicum]